MNYLDKLKPGKRENAFYVKSNVVDIDKSGVVSANSKRFYIRIWDPEKQQHVKKLVEKE